ncbi:glycoside hydrolase family 15 protein [Streptomyces flaveus]|uniref:glycoside hydrolase family 15 protein n=1 Tax=Streptomyces flaveus TaxID=66370 RepID=UPI001BCA2CA9
MPSSPCGDTTELLAETQEFWQQWTVKFTYQGPWRETVLRSLITLKALIDVGLLSEEWDPVAHRQLGNTPQAFSHVGLVNTAFALHGTRNEARRRQGSP